MKINNRKFRKKGIQIGVTSLALLMGVGAAVNYNFDSINAEDVSILNNQKSETEKVIDVASTEWKYLDNNTDPAVGSESLTTWTLNAFNDSTWKSGVGKFGAKRGALAEVGGFMPTVLLDQYYEESKDTPTFFFRTKINVTNVSEVTSLTGSFYHDDAVAIYLNGHLISSVDMPTDVQNSNLYYAGVSAGDPKLGKISLSREEAANYMVEGENVIAVELHNDRESSSDIYFEFTDLNVNKNEITTIEHKSVILTVGSDETSRNLTWYTNTASAGKVQYAKKSTMVNNAFPTVFATADALSSAANDAGYYSNQATMNNLEENTEYVYRVVNDETVSDVYSFKTSEFDGEFSFALVGDPQIGTGGYLNGIEGWDTTLKTIVSQLNPDFMISAGDQVDKASDEEQYTGYLNETLSSLASASTIGNHDSGSIAYQQHFNLSNESDTLGTTTAGGDYWFVYNNTLFMDINSNDRSTAEHKQFLEEAIAANPDVKWKTVIFHHSIYSTASHVNDGDIITRREELPQVFDELDIDVVLMGHDHVYTRTYMMDGFTPDRTNGVQDSVLNPTGILYLTANSASGSKYYDLKAADAEYSAVTDQSYRRTVTDVTISDTAYTMTTYYADDMSVLDTFTIYKSADVDKTSLNELINSANALEKGEYTSESWNSLQKALDEANSVNDNVEATQDEVDAAYNSLKSAVDSLIKANVSTETKKENENKNKVNTGDTTNATSLGLLLLSAGGIILINKNKFMKH